MSAARLRRFHMLVAFGVVAGSVSAAVGSSRASAEVVSYQRAASADLLDISIDTSTHTTATNIGATVVYAIVVTNQASSTMSAANPRVTNPMPVGLVAVAAAGEGWNCTTTPALVECVYDDSLAPGQHSTITVGTNTTTSASTITNVASVTVDGVTFTSDTSDAVAVSLTGTKLPITGSDPTGVTAVAGVLVASGIGLVLVSGRRRRPG